MTLCVYVNLTRPWLKEGLSCSAEPQDPEPLRSSIAVKQVKKINLYIFLYKTQTIPKSEIKRQNSGLMMIILHDYSGVDM